MDYEGLMRRQEENNICLDDIRIHVKYMTQDSVLQSYVIGLASPLDSEFNLSVGISKELENEMNILEPENGLKEVKIK